MTRCIHCAKPLRWWQDRGHEVNADGTQQRWHGGCGRAYARGYYRGITHRGLELLTEQQLREVIADSERWAA